MRVKEVGVSQGDFQQRLDDVANSAVVRKADFLSSADKISQAKSTRKHNSNGSVYTKAVFFFLNCLSLYQRRVIACALVIYINICFVNF